MSCGLGAIILVFMLVKYNDATSVPEVELLKADLDQLQAVEANLRDRLYASRMNSDEVDKSRKQAAAELSRLESAVSTSRLEIIENQSLYQGLKAEIEAIEVTNTEDVIEVPGAGEENYLIGLKVEGRKIGIMLDTSASMTDERLIDVIQRKNRSDSDKVEGPKWQRAKAITRWLLARLPVRSRVSVIAFSETARPLRGAGWTSATDANGLAAIMQDLDAVIPAGATNLQSGLDMMNDEGPTNLYLITDGLPTMGNSSYRSLNPFADCSALWGGSSKISGACRLALFNHTLESSAPKSDVTVNVILLPIEGDPEASPAFWTWTGVTGGLLISPAENWP